MSVLVACPSCSAHVRTSESSCPHCEARISSDPGHPVRQTAGAVLMGLSLTACVITSSPDYGVADTGDISSGGPASSSSTGGADTGSSTGDASTGGTTTGTSGTSSGSESSTGGTDGSSTGAGSTTTLGGPDYGVPETTGK